MASPLLFSPMHLRGLELRNRLWIPPMCQYSASGDGMPTDWHTVHYGAFARGGAALVIVEATGVVPEGRITPGCLGLWNEEQAEGFARIAEIVHAHGARIAVQLGHAGRKGSTYRALPGEPSGSIPVEAGGWQTVSPSAVPFPGFADPHPLTLDEIGGVVEAFADAATRAVGAGLDAVEIHAAHGYLLHSFLSPLSNHRDDAYGGPLESRARLLREVVRAIRARHAELPIIVRLSASEWREDGFEVDEATDVARWLAEDGADFIDVSSAGNLPEAPPRIGPGYQVALAQRVRSAGLPVSAVGLIVSAQQAETILATGQADAIEAGRAALRDPHLPLAWAQELRAEVLPDLVPGQYARAWR